MSETTSSEAGRQQPVRNDPAPAPQPPARSGGGWAPGALAGLIGGGAIAALGTYYTTEAQKAADPTSRVVAVEQRVAGTEKTLGDLAALTGRLTAQDEAISGLRGALDTTQKRIESFAADVAALQRSVTDTDKTAQASSQAVTGIQTSLSSLMSELGGLTSKVQPLIGMDAESMKDVVSRQKLLEQREDKLTDDLGAAQKELSTIVAQLGNDTGALRVSLGDLTKRIDGLAAQQEALASAEKRVADVETAIAAHDKKLAAVEEAAAAAQKQAAQVQSAVDESAGSLKSLLDQKVGDLQGTLNQKVGDLQGAIEQKATDLSGQITAATVGKQNTAGLALAVQELRDALDTGKPFATSLDLVKQLSGGDAEIEPLVAKLEPMATTGAPSLAVLAEHLDTVMAEVSAKPAQQGSAPAEEPAGDDWMSNTLRNLGTLTALPAGNPSEVSAVATAKRAVAGNDLQGAVTALKPVADAGYPAAQAWIAEAQARLDAKAGVDALNERVKAMLTAKS
ncbi:MAG: hypothetical protein U1E45_22485 [Geminicoccaceae bacterium]